MAFVPAHQARPGLRAALVTTFLTDALLGPHAANAKPQQIVEIPVTFDVLNVIRSGVACPTDGGQYHVGGHLVASTDALRDADAATVYLPGAIATERSAWRQKGFDGRYDMATGMARLGHLSVVINRLAFDTSGTPNGFLSCIGGEADVVNQVIGRLRAGTYEFGTLEEADDPRSRGPRHGDSPRAESVAFDRVALAGQSYGGFLATVTAHSFANVDALILIASAVEQGMPPKVVASVAQHTTEECGTGGLPKREGGPGGYTHLIGLFDEFFGEMEPPIKADFIARAEREPCGLVASIGSAVAANRVGAGTIDVPVLLVGAENDWAFPPDAMRSQHAMFTGADDTSLVFIENAGHTVMIERGLADGLTASERLRLSLSAWLTPRGF